MAKLSPQDEATLKRLIEARDAPDDVDEVLIRADGREYAVKGSTAAKVLSRLFGDEPAGKAPAKKATKKAAPPAPPEGDDDDGDQGDDGDEGDEGDEGEEPPETDPSSEAKKHWYFR